jgi:hypothetical protein
VDEGDDDTLTESCEGAINFMVIEMEVGSLQKLPFRDVVEVKFGAGCGQAEDLGFVSRTVDASTLFFMNGSADRHQRPVRSDIWLFAPRLILILRRRRPIFL